jgi:Glycosyltransferases involved in cell wall biogenesis
VLLGIAEAFGVFRCFAVGGESVGSQPKVSIIVAVYNMEEYLSDCLDSLINQTLQDIEIICVDDGSTDASLQILNEYAKREKRIKVIHKENGGVSSAKNAGIEAATGEYITFVDSDDWIDLDGLEVLYNAAEKNNADIVCGGWRNVPHNGCGRKDCCPKDEIYHDWFAAKCKRESIIACNKLYRRTLIIGSGIRFNRNINYAEDECLNLSIYPLARTIVGVNNKYYNYRVRDTSATFASFHKKMANYNKVWKCTIPVWKSYGVEKSIYPKLLIYPFLAYKDEITAFFRSCFPKMKIHFIF